MTIIQKTQHLLLKGTILIIRALPRRAALRAGRLLGLLAWACIPLHRKIARTQMRQALGAGYDETLLRRAFMHQGGLIVDMVKAAYMDDRRLRELIDVEGREHLDRALASGRPVMVIAGHMNWEILGHAPRVSGISLCVMADFIKNPAFQAVSEEIRSRCRVRVLPPKGGMVKQLIRELEEHSIVGMIIDQRGRRENRLFCDVLGMPAPTSPAPAFIALRAGAIVLPLAGFRKGDRYLFRWYEPFDSRAFGSDWTTVPSLYEAWRSGAVQGLSRAMQSWVSEVVMEHPEQWFWLHCRWARRSDMAKIVRKGLDFGKFVSSQAEGYLPGENVL